jgi:FkbM family methyltransferase
MLSNSKFKFQSLKKFGIDNEFVKTWHILGSEVYVLVDIYSYIDQQIIYNKKYSKNINFHIMKNIRPESIYLDVGANIGSTSLPVAILHPTVEVNSFEPNPKIYEKLSKNIRLNSITNIAAFNIGIGSSNSPAQFYFSGAKKTNHGTSSLNLNADIVSPVEIEIDIRRIDDLYANPDKPIGLIKIDVQGFEMDVLLGARLTVKRFAPIILFEQEDLYQSDADKKKQFFKEFFAELHYIVFEIDKYDHRNLREVDWSIDMNANLIALPMVQKH